MSTLGPQQSNYRATILIAIFLTLLTLGGVGFFVVLIGPAFLGVLAVVALVGFCHYFLWGRSMDQQVQADADEAGELPPESDGWTGNGHPRRF
jgi:hypothetical protein